MSTSTTRSPAAGTGAATRDALAVAVPVGVTGIAFGAVGTAAGLSVAQCCAFSLLAFTGASQYALAGAIAAGGNPFAAVAGALLLGARNGIYGLRLRGLLGLSRGQRPLAAQLVIDETTAVALGQGDRHSTRRAFTVAGVVLFVLWNATTALGAFGAGALTDTSAFGLDAAGPAAFLALVVPRLADRREGRAVAVVGAAVALAATPLLTSGIPVLCALLAVPGVLAVYRALPASRRGGGR